MKAKRLFKDLKWYLKRFYRGIRCRGSSFSILNGFQLSKEKQQFLEDNHTWKKELEYFTVYRLKNDIRETIVMKLKEEELFRLNDILLDELFIFGSIDYVPLRDKTLKAVYPPEDREYRYYGNLLDFYLNNYSGQKDESPISQGFLEAYRYAINRIRGETVLDVGSGSGVFPVLLKLKRPDIEVTASDRNYEYFNEFALPYCEDKKIGVKFIELDILPPAFLEKKYDTVTTIHTLEHFEEKDNPEVIRNLLQLANQRLIAVVPFEKFITSTEHKQKLDKKKLERTAGILGLPYRIEQISEWHHALIIDLNR